ncbi:MAG: ornithine carbamoyltransferase [Acidobacteria bacterium]|nr:ornithine carbamoyltransferase [Acidobacteriota bacterium]
MTSTDLISIHDLPEGEVHEIFAVARDVKAFPERYSGALNQKTLAMLFEKPSLRTRVTFEAGMTQLGGHAIYLAQDVGLGKRESVRDIAKNLERWVDGIMCRTFAHKTVTDMALHAGIPVINGLTDLLHPCQALADYLTLIEKFGDLRGRKIAYVGDGNNVAHSLMFGAAKLGMEIRVGTPAGYEPNAEIVSSAREDAKRTGGKVEVVRDPFEAVRGVDAVYTDVWASMGQEAEAANRAKVFPPYQVNSKLMAAAAPHAVFLHCLPAHRNDEVTDEVLDGPQSVVFDESENRLHVQKAIMILLMGKR